MEKAKYDLVWKHEQYAKVSPAFHRHYELIRDYLGSPTTVIDFGSGAGYIIPELERMGHEVLAVDHSAEALRVEADFHQACVWEEMDIRAKKGICIDVMEHIPTERVHDAFREIMTCVDECLFMVHLAHDRVGSQIAGAPLHMTVQPVDWWVEEASLHGSVEGVDQPKPDKVFFKIC